MVAVYSNAAQRLIDEKGYWVGGTMFWGNWPETAEMRQQGLSTSTLTPLEIERLRAAHGSATPNIRRAERVKAAMQKEPGISVRKLAEQIGEGQTQTGLDMRAFRS